MAKFDEMVEEHGVRVVIDAGAIMHVVGTNMDFVEDRLRLAHFHLMPMLCCLPISGKMYVSSLFGTRWLIHLHMAATLLHLLWWLVGREEGPRGEGPPGGGGVGI